MTTIYYRRRTLTRMLRAELPSAFLTVSSPDHPLLVRGPDLIVSTERTCVAIFTPSAAERRSRLLLKSRFVLSKLAFPPHARFILIVEIGDESLAQSFANDFADIIEWRARSSIIEIIQDRNFVGRHRDLPPDVAENAQVTFSNAMTVMRLSARLSRRPFTAAFGEALDLDHAEVYTGSEARRRSPKPLIYREKAPAQLEGVAFAEMADTPVDAAAVREIVNEQAAYVYTLDNGIPYSRSEATGIGVIADWPRISRDPEKLIHAAAFAGWAFILSQNRNELPQFARRLKRRRLV